MFDFVRKHTRIMQLLLFLLIFPSFVLFGVDGYNRFVEKGEAVAVVDGQDITRAEWDAAHRNEVERLRASMPGLDAKLFDSPEVRYGTLDRLVRERLLQLAATKMHHGVAAISRHCILAPGRRHLGHGALPSTRGRSGHDA
jgi:peptidyl-prolyl cis-trans isomerase D